MLPRALQRAKRPAEPLLGETAESIGRFRVGDGAVGIGDRVPRATKRQSEILIFGERILAKATCLLDRGAPPCAHGTGYDGDAIEQGEGAAVEVLTRHVF